MNTKLGAMLSGCFAAVLLSIAVFSTAAVADTASRVFFKSPADGAVVTSPVAVQMGLEGMTLAPAGEVKAGEGHHHIIVDGAPIKAGEVVPSDATHLHFGKAQTEAQVPLAPGKHTLTLQLADGAHKSYGPGLSSTISVTVK